MEQGSAPLLAAVTRLSSEVQGENPRGLKNEQEFPFSWFIAAISCLCGCFFCRFLNYLLINRLHQWGGRGAPKNASQ